MLFKGTQKGWGGNWRRKGLRTDTERLEKEKMNLCQSTNNDVPTKGHLKESGYYKKVVGHQRSQGGGGGKKTSESKGQKAEHANDQT